MFSDRRIPTTTPFRNPQESPQQTGATTFSRPTPPLLIVVNMSPFHPQSAKFSIVCAFETPFANEFATRFSFLTTRAARLVNPEFVVTAILHVIESGLTSYSPMSNQKGAVQSREYPEAPYRAA